MALVVVCACSSGDRDDSCEGFACAPITGVDGGSETGEDTGASSSSSGAESFCSDADTRCLGDEVLQYCDEDGEKLRKIDCQAACGMDQVSLGCGIGDSGRATCFCGPAPEPPPVTTGGADDDTEGADEGADESTDGGADEGAETGDDETGGGGGKCSDPEFPVWCFGQHGLAPGCWPAGVSCDTIVPCPSGNFGCGAGHAVDCTEIECVPVLDWVESSNALCSNGEDDDGDDLADCNDLFCYANPSVTVCNGESTDEECANGLDDDGDGAIDCDDWACLMSPAVTVCGPLEWSEDACSNGDDDDADGYTDCDDAICQYNPFTSICW